jgi:hypothetical protein
VASRVINYREGNSSAPLGYVPVAGKEKATPPAPVRVIGRIYLFKDSRYVLDGVADTGGGPILAAFACRAEAEAALQAHRREHLDAWLAHPHFHFHCLTSLSPEVFRDAVLDLGLEPPPPAAADDPWAWEDWWRAGEAVIGEWRRWQLMSLFDLLSPYRVVEVPLAE